MDGHDNPRSSHADLNEMEHGIRYYDHSLPDVMTWTMTRGCRASMTAVVRPISSANIANQPIYRAYEK